MEKIKTIDQIALNNKILKKWFQDFKKKKKPIKINIRSLTTNVDVNEKKLHNIHKYPAKLTYRIANLFVNNSILSNEGDVLFDPFMGSGTTLLEGIKAGRNVIGIDANPLAYLISKVKTGKFRKSALTNYLNFLKNNRYKNIEKAEIISELKIWFLPQIYQELMTIEKSIAKIKNKKYKEFFMLCFSQLLHKVSNADPRINVPVLLRSNKYVNEKQAKAVRNRLTALTNLDVHSMFEQQVKENIEIVAEYHRTKDVWVELLCRDINDSLDSIKNSLVKRGRNSIDLIITSPPYAGAQKYIRASRINLLWLGHSKIQIQDYDKKTIGRETVSKTDKLMVDATATTATTMAGKVIERIKRKNLTRATIAYHYIKEMTNAFAVVEKSLKRGGYLVLIVGDNTICGLKFKNHLYLNEILEKLGLRLLTILEDRIQSFGMMTKRNKNAGIIKKEYILIYKKEL